MIDKDAALQRYDSLMLRGRKALTVSLENLGQDTTYEKPIWFDTDEFISDLEHFLNEALAKERSYLYGENLVTGCKQEFPI